MVIGLYWSVLFLEVYLIKYSCPLMYATEKDKKEETPLCIM